VIAEAIERDPEVEVKRRAVIALGRLPREEGVPLLIDVARSNRSTALRRQAMQTLGQSNDPRALAFFEQVLLK
jgi:HEAT repeat protein